MTSDEVLGRNERHPHAGLVWSHPSIEHSSYKNSRGRIQVRSPWRLVDDWDRTRGPDPETLTIS